MNTVVLFKQTLQTEMKRSRLETLNTILCIAVNGIKKTHIMYRANLSHGQLEKFLELLIRKGLLKKESNSFFTTGKGLQFIEEFKKIQSLILDEQPLKKNSKER